MKNGLFYDLHPSRTGCLGFQVLCVLPSGVMLESYSTNQWICLIKTHGPWDSHCESCGNFGIMLCGLGFSEAHQNSRADCQDLMHTS